MGYNNDGAIGDGTVVSKSVPTQEITKSIAWASVSEGFGGGTNAGIKTDGTLWLWGFNDIGQLGNNSTLHRSSPVQTVAGGTNWSKVAANPANTFAIKTDGTLWAWGFNF